MATRTGATAVWTGHITLGMISVPVKLYSAARSEGISFNQVHKCKNESGQLTGTVTKINEQKFCSGCNKVVASADLSKGFERAKGDFVIIEDSELKALSPGKVAILEITSFVPLAEVDPIYFDKSYFVGVQDAGRKPYEVIFRTMNGTKLAGMAKLTMRGKEYNVFVRTYGNGIMVDTLFSEAEVRDLAEYNTYRGDVVVSETEVKMGRMLLESMTTSFDKAALVDTYQVKVEALVASKTATTGTSSASTPSTPRNDDDLLAALAASIKNAKKPVTPVTPINEKKAAA